MPENELMPKIYKGLTQLNNKQQVTNQKGSWVLKNEQIIWTDVFSKEDVLLVQEKMLSITNHQGSAYQNHNETPPHTW